MILKSLNAQSKHINTCLIYKNLFNNKIKSHLKYISIQKIHYKIIIYLDDL